MQDKVAFRFGLKNPDALLIESETFRATTYIIKDNEICIDGGNCGRIAIKMDLVDGLINELKEVVENYKK